MRGFTWVVCSKKKKGGEGRFIYRNTKTYPPLPSSLTQSAIRCLSDPQSGQIEEIKTQAYVYVISSKKKNVFLSCRRRCYHGLGASARTLITPFPGVFILSDLQPHVAKFSVLQNFHPDSRLYSKRYLPHLF